MCGGVCGDLCGEWFGKYVGGVSGEACGASGLGSMQESGWGGMWGIYMARRWVRGWIVDHKPPTTCTHHLDCPSPTSTK